MDDARIRSLRCDFPFLIEDPVDLYYLTGLTLSQGRLLIRPNETTLFVDSRYFDAAKAKAPCSVALWAEFKNVIEPKIGFDSAFVTYEKYLSLKKDLPSTEWVALPNPLQNVRAIKEPDEIVQLKRAALVTWKGYQHIRSLLKVGVSEEELAFEFELFCRKAGAERLAFEPIIAFGEHGAYPHYRAGSGRLKEGDAVLIDVGAVVNRYCGDMTRLVYFGKPDPRIVAFERLVKEAKELAILAIKPGVKVGMLDQIVQDHFEKANVKPLYIHTLGHGVGLNIHEFPRLRYDGVDKDVLLKPGMVFTIEPGLYQPGVGGVRLEDTLVVTENGSENFYPAE